MNLDRYEKIDGGFAGAVAHMAKGKAAYTEDEMQYVIDQDGILFYAVGEHGLRESSSWFNHLSAMDWYIPKPFDVRQAMRDKPDEWVGAFEDRKGEWHKVGFDTESFMAIETSYASTVKCEFYAYNVRQATEKEMDACIPIEDVPEEATR